MCGVLSLSWPCETSPCGRGRVARLWGTAWLLHGDEEERGDPDGDELTYQWFIDGSTEAGEEGKLAELMLEAGPHTVKLVIMDPYLFKPDYSVDLNPALKEMSWEGDGRDSLKLYVVVNASEGVPEKTTANLIGPLVINTQKCEAVQIVIYDSPYSHRYPILGPLPTDHRPLSTEH